MQSRFVILMFIIEVHIRDIQVQLQTCLNTVPSFYVTSSVTGKCVKVAWTVSTLFAKLSESIDFNRSNKQIKIQTKSKPIKVFQSSQIFQLFRWLSQNEPG